MKIEIKSKSFGERIIFKDLSLLIRDGESTLICGESGRGKTTLLRMIASLDEDYCGHIDASDGVLLFQENRLIENMSVLSNLELVTDDRRRALGLLKELGLEGEEKSIVSTLSGGMKRRVAIARVLLLESTLYLLDEPFSALDDDTKKKTAEVIRRNTEGKTIIVVSHDIEDGRLLCCSSVVDL